ncbi:hypothetical protein [Microbacterium gorillae]|uniref:hypothetical protein n=1 Tax=Microbacterium gorillae TaxID=1231063 RepID=UPI00058E91CE|nr:hypothetical protein [Microbacterium gorillae]
MTEPTPRTTRPAHRVALVVVSVVLLAFVAQDIAGWVRLWHDADAIIEYSRLLYRYPSHVPLVTLLCVLTPVLWLAVTGLVLGVVRSRLTPAGRRWLWPAFHALNALAAIVVLALTMWHAHNAGLQLALFGAIAVIAAGLAVMTGWSARATNAEERANPDLDVDGADAWYNHRGDASGPRPSEDERGPDGS